MPRDKIILIAAFASGLLAFVLVFSQLNKASKPAYSVVVASQDIASGAQLESGHLAASKPIRNIDTTDFFLQPVDAVGFVLTEPAKKGEPIRRSRSMRPQPVAAPAAVEPGVTPPVIPADMRVMDLGSAEVDKIPDLIQVGYFVDLFGFKGGAQTEFKALVFSAPVVAVQRNDGDAVTAISIGLTLGEAEEVAAGLKKGKLRLAVRTEPGEKIQSARSRVGVMEVIRGASAPSLVSFNVTGDEASAPEADGSELLAEEGVEP